MKPLCVAVVTGVLIFVGVSILEALDVRVNVLVMGSLGGVSALLAEFVSSRFMAARSA